MFHFIGDLLSPPRAHRRLSIVIYHRVLRAPDSILEDETHAAAFEMHVRLLAGEFNVLRLSEACARLKAGDLPTRAVCITFDDGYADNHEVALPILKRHGVVATFFVSPGYSEGGSMFNDIVIEALRAAPAGAHDLADLGLGHLQLGDSASRRAGIDALIRQIKYRAPAERMALAAGIAAAVRSAVPRNLMMTPAQIRRMHDEGMEIGAHTVTHPILASIGEDEARAEIVDSRGRLEEIVGAPVTLFAYPNGTPGRDYRPEHVRLVKEAGYSAAVAAVGGIAHGASDPFQLPRFGLYDRTPFKLGARLLAGYVRPLPA
ncbi:MAG TPA: polysaccharide deacetylase family protein [Burkholderiales bacterium]|nr:polysaccharide deacetylase family protein [Burkholderiales bacterium]